MEPTPIQTPGAVPAQPAPQPRHGPCSTCEHFRRGTSVTGATFAALLDPLKPKVNEAHSEKTKEEREGLDQYRPEVELRLQDQFDEWSRRPVGQIVYCGLHEFEGRFHITEVKNQDQRCDDFLPRQTNPEPHACSTCVYNIAPLNEVLMTLDQTVGRTDRGRDLREKEIQPALNAQAEREYRDCVEGGGFLRSQPGLLPRCEVYSTASDELGLPRYVVGPVVNGGARCVAWERGVSPTRAQTSEELARLRDEARRTWEISEHPPPVRLAPGEVLEDVFGPAHSAAGNDEADIVEYCLTLLGLNADYVSSIGIRFMQSVWYRPRVVDDGSAAAASPAPTTAAGPGVGSAMAQPSQPFPLQPLVAYQHPTYHRVWFQVMVGENEVTIAVHVGAAEVHFNLAALPMRTWTQLRTTQGALPITILSDAPSGVYAAWY